jgi:hypothetical protein
MLTVSEETVTALSADACKECEALTKELTWLISISEHHHVASSVSPC